MSNIGVDVLVDRKEIPVAELHEALALAIDVPNSRVSVICDITDYPARGQADTVCTVSSVEGQFPTLLSMDGQPGQVEDVLAFVERLSQALNAECLTGTDDANPYAMWHVEPKKSPRRVFLVANAADGGRYDIDRPEP